MALKLVPHDHEILRHKIPTFDFNNPPTDPADLAGKLAEFMIKKNGLFLTAPQVGLPYRAFVMVGNPPFAIFNPRLVDETTKEEVLEEISLSRPNLTLKIKRPSIIKVRFQDMDGNTHTEKFIGLTARLIQQGIDYLDGIDYTRRANPIHLQRALNKKKQLDRAAK